MSHLFYKLLIIQLDIYNKLFRFILLAQDMHMLRHGNLQLLMVLL
jgi:hypothetical protein